MPSRPIFGNPRATLSSLKSKILFLATSLSVTAVIFSTLAYILYHFWSSLFQRSRTRPFEDTTPPNLQRFTYKELNSATNDFDPENAIGKGGSGSVFRGILKDGKSVAVKSIDPCSSLHAEKEFQNELTILGSIRSPLIVSLLGFCVHKSKRILVYEYMPNRSLQELLFCRDASSVVGWDTRFHIIRDVCRALEFLHNECDPPVIHGDIKPSNVLLDWDFKAKVCDFGLSRLKVEVEDPFGDELFSQELDRIQEMDWESKAIDPAIALQASTSSKNSLLNPELQTVAKAKSVPSPKGKEVLRLGVLDDDLCGGNVASKDWWWKQDGGSDALCSKDYVMEWIGSQICARPSNPEWDGVKPSSVSEVDLKIDHHQYNTNEVLKEKKRRGMNQPKKMQDWWKEEKLEEGTTSKMGSKKRSLENKLRKMSYKSTRFHLGQCFHMMKGSIRSKDGDQGPEISYAKTQKKKKAGTPSMNSEMWSGDVLSRELSSNTSMRGTLCYAAPEYGACGFLMEKTDIYSLGVLILVTVSGRRPLNVLNSHMKMEKANLVSWCRQLAQAGNVLELMDERLNGSYNKEQATLCINLGLACLQRMPELRPDVGDILRILEGEMDLPVVLFEFSPSPPCKVLSGSRRKH